MDNNLYVCLTHHCIPLKNLLYKSIIYKSKEYKFKYQIISDRNKLNCLIFKQNFQEDIEGTGLAKDSQIKKWCQGRYQIKGLSLKSFVETLEIFKALSSRLFSPIQRDL